MVEAKYQALTTKMDKGFHFIQLILIDNLMLKLNPFMPLTSKATSNSLLLNLKVKLTDKPQRLMVEE